MVRFEADFDGEDDRQIFSMDIIEGSPLVTSHETGITALHVTVSVASLRLLAPAHYPIFG